MKRFFLYLIYIISVTDCSAQVLSWAQEFSGTTGATSTGPAILTSSNNSITTVHFNGTVDFDKSSNVYNLTGIGMWNLGILKQDAAGNFLWVKHFAGLSSLVLLTFARDICEDTFGNIYITGAFRDSFDFDPGPAVYKMASVGNFSNQVENVFVLKLNSSGDFIWARQLGGAGLNSSSGQGIRVDKTGNIFLASNFSGSIDADPGPNVLTLNGSGIMIHKLDTSGNLVWVKHIVQGGPVWSFTKDSLSNLYFTGQFASTIDFDPGSGIVNLSPVGATDVFIEKLDSSGSFQWVKQVGGGSNDISNGITLDPSANVLVTGYFGGTVDFDPGPGTYNLTSNSTRSAFTLKLNNNGDFKWANKTGASVGLFNGRSIATDSAGSVYTALELPNSCDINPGAGVFTVPAGVAVQNLDSAGNFVWGAGWQGDIPGWIGLDHNNSVYTTGTFSGANKDFDPGPGTYYLSGSGQGSGFIHKMCQGTPPVVSITASDTVGCNGDTVVLTATTLPGTYHWSRNNVTLPDTTASIKITSGGTYTVRVSESCPSIGTHQIFFYSKANPVISLPVGPMSVNIGQQASVTATVVNPGAGSTINWYKNGVLFNTTTATNVSYTKTAGTDTIVAVIFGPGNPCYNPDTSNALIIDAVNSVEDLISANGIAVYPNPSHGIFTFSSSTLIDHIEVTNLTGKTVLTAAPKANSFTIDLSGKSAGVYFYELSLGERKLRGKVVVQ